MAINAITARIDGLVSYTDNTKEPFQASFDSKVQQQMPTAQQVNGQVPYSDSTIVASIDTALGAFSLVGAPIADPGRGAVRNINLTINCQVTSDTNAKQSFAIIFEKVGATETARFEGDAQALTDLAADATFLATFNTVLTNAIGSSLVALG